MFCSTLQSRQPKIPGLVKPGDVIVITGGTPNGKSGNSNLINIETV